MKMCVWLIWVKYEPFLWRELDPRNEVRECDQRCVLLHLRQHSIHVFVHVVHCLSHGLVKVAKWLGPLAAHEIYHTVLYDRNATPAGDIGLSVEGLMVPRQQRDHQRATCPIRPLTDQRRTDVHALLNTHSHQSFQPLNRILRRSAVRQYPQVVLHRGTESLCGSSEAVSHSPECRTPLRTCSSECAALAAPDEDLGATVRLISAGCAVRSLTVRNIAGHNDRIFGAADETGDPGHVLWVIHMYVTDCM